MSSPQEQIETEVKQALKAGEKERLSTLRMLLNAIKNERIRIGEEVDEPGFYNLVRKSIKQREESAEQYTRGGRDELAARERREAEILAAYLPPQIAEAELVAAIREFLHSQELSGPQAMGPVMKAMMARFSGQTDGGTVNRLVRQVLAESD